MDEWKSDSARGLSRFSECSMACGIMGIIFAVIFGLYALFGDEDALNTTVYLIIGGLSCILTAYTTQGFARLINEVITIREGIDLLNQSNKPLPNKNSEIKETYNSDLPDL